LRESKVPKLEPGDKSLCVSELSVIFEALPPLKIVVLVTNGLLRGGESEFMAAEYAVART